MPAGASVVGRADFGDAEVEPGGPLRSAAGAVFASEDESGDFPVTTAAVLAEGFGAVSGFFEDASAWLGGAAANAPPGNKKTAPKTLRNAA